MDLGLHKKRFERCKSVYCGSVIHEENTEMIVPDQSPDISRIIKGSADVFLKDKNARDGKIDISGNIKGVVLYIAEGENDVRKLNVSMPFAYALDAEGTTPDSKITVDVRLRSVDVREVNPRKVSVRVSVDVRACAYAMEEISLCEGVVDEDKFGVCTRNRNISLYQPVAMREKSFAISDDIELSSKENDMSGILTSSVNLIVSDTKIIGNKTIIKGVADINYVYSLLDGSLVCSEHELPFSQIIDIDGMEDNNDLKITISLSGYELDPQYDASGKARYITVSITGDVTAIAFANEDICMIDDVYSTKYELSFEHNDVSCVTLHDRIEKRVAVTETVETGCGVKQVLDVEIVLLPASRRREEGGEVLVTDALITVMYEGEDDSLYSASRRASIVCPFPLSEGYTYDANTQIRGKSYSIGSNDRINVRFFVDFDITETENITVSSIATISTESESTKSYENSPSVTVKRLQQDCDIWMLAKEHSTTVEEIKIANDITDDVFLTAGRMVLIPKKR